MRVIDLVATDWRKVKEASSHTEVILLVMALRQCSISICSSQFYAVMKLRAMLRHWMKPLRCICMGGGELFEVSLSTRGSS